MGWFGSDDIERAESRTIDTSGNVNNNIVIQEAADTHTAMILNEKLLFATYMLVAAELLKLGLYIFHVIRKAHKKRYSAK